jgi:2,5-diamino-6-(ribosylamino)-4(3H)-pyrimidinone 5'-phosphate reductase
MLMSVDGKISTGDADNRDVDKDFPTIAGVSEGLQQYYDLEKQTDNLSFNTGRVMAKIGLNDRTESPNKIPCSFVIVDNEPHLKDGGIRYLSKWTEKLFLVTTDKNHPAVAIQEELGNVTILSYESEIDFGDLFKRLKDEFSFERMTIQSGGTMNATLIRAGLVDHLSIVVAPALVGGKNTATLVDGDSLRAEADLTKIRPLRLTECAELKHSYLNVKYDVINN